MSASLSSHVRGDRGGSHVRGGRGGGGAKALPLLWGVGMKGLACTLICEGEKVRTEDLGREKEEVWGGSGWRGEEAQSTLGCTGSWQRLSSLPAAFLKQVRSFD